MPVPGAGGERRGRVGALNRTWRVLSIFFMSAVIPGFTSAVLTVRSTITGTDGKNGTEGVRVREMRVPQGTVTIREKTVFCETQGMYHKSSPPQKKNVLGTNDYQEREKQTKNEVPRIVKLL